MIRGATLFSGGRGVELLLKNDINFHFAVEFDPQIAAIGAQLGGHTIVSDVRLVDYSTWGALDYLHASPVCKNFSAAKANGVETDDDMTTAAAVVRCLEATQPRVFTLENVQQYEGSASYRLIVSWLNHNGYMWHAQTLNAADYGVPQTRRRLIVRAVRNALLPTLPPPVKWVGWYAAIEDLIPGLPESQFAPWQLARLPESMNRSTAFAQGCYGDDLTMAGHEAPIFTITSNSNQNNIKSFIVDGKPKNYDGALQVCDGDDRIVTVTASQTRHPMRAFLVPDQNSGQGRGDWMRDDAKPSMTLGATATARAWLQSGRVVKMTPRALARFQSFPDWYQLPDKSSLACTIIGNSVPPLLMRAVVLPLL